VLVVAERHLEELELGELAGPRVGGCGRLRVEPAVGQRDEVAELCAPGAKPCGAAEASKQEPHGQGRPLLERLAAHRDQHDPGRDREDHDGDGEAGDAP
jgi:hypothetical protein